MHVCKVIILNICSSAGFSTTTYKLVPTYIFMYKTKITINNGSTNFVIWNSESEIGKCGPNGKKCYFRFPKIWARNFFADRC